MTASRKRTPAETWRALEDSATEAEMDRVLALTDDALDRELAGAGMNPDELRARGEELGRRAAGERAREAAEARPREGANVSRLPIAAPAQPQRLGLRRGRWALLFAAALAAILFAIWRASDDKVAAPYHPKAQGPDAASAKPESDDPPR